MTLKYSNTTGNFYPDSESYETLPADAVTVSHEDMVSALSNPPELGFKFSKDGKLSFFDNPAAKSDPAIVVRNQRDQLLKDCDYLAMPDYPLIESDKAELRGYRQALRDVTEQDGFPNNVIWPTKPGFVK